MIVDLIIVSVSIKPDHPIFLSKGIFPATRDKKSHLPPELPQFLHLCRKYNHSLATPQT
jgi:hypothetical protein